MRILFIGGVFDDCHAQEIISKTKTYVEYAANNFQRKIIEGFRENGIEIEVLSAPFLGAFPHAYKDILFTGFKKKNTDNSGYRYVKFNNIWGVRNPSRRRAIKKGLKDFISSPEEKKLIIVYTPHTPFVQAAEYAKKRDPRIQICLVVPDLPQYMNLADKASKAYKFFKKYDVNAFMKSCKSVDTFMILTECMKYPLNIGIRPYVVVEGIYEELEENRIQKDKGVIKVVYTGKLDRNFGVMKLIDSFGMINNKNYRLIICGNGEASEDVKKAAEKDERIIYKGQVSSNEARRIILEGDVLVNPRQNNSEYTKYSFPSKIIDYLSTGNPVVAYKLDGMPDQYGRFIYFVQNNTTEELAKTIEHVINAPEAEKKEKCVAGKQYLQNVISKKNIASVLLELNGMKAVN